MLVYKVHFKGKYTFCFFLQREAAFQPFEDLIIYIQLLGAHVYDKLLHT